MENKREAFTLSDQEMKDLLRLQTVDSGTPNTPQLALQMRVRSLKNLLDVIESQCLRDYKHLSAQNIPLVEGMPNPNPFDTLSVLLNMLSSYVSHCMLPQSPEYRSRTYNRF